MLPDPINLIKVNNHYTETGDLGTPQIFRVTDPGATIGRTVRQGSTTTFSNVELVISHSESKESKPYGTKRVQLRADAVKGAGTVDEPVARPFVQIIFGQPKALVTSDEMYELLSLLATFALVGESVDAHTSDSADGKAMLARLLNGEG